MLIDGWIDGQTDGWMSEPKEWWHDGRKAD